MCQMADIGDGRLVADIKKSYILNIAEQAKRCDNISRVVLFGSALDTRCTEQSDIDIAVFGKRPQTEYLRSREFKEFQHRLFAFSFAQDYDILYFCDSADNQSAIMGDILKGTEIYRRSAS